MAEAQGEKTEKPSPKRLKDARERGQVAVSRDLSMAAGSLAATAALVACGTMLMHRLTGAIASSLSHIGDAPLRAVSPEDLMPIVTAGGALIAMTVGPIAIAAAATGLLSSVAQTGFNFSTDPLKPNWERLSPKNGFSKLAPSR